MLPLTEILAVLVMLAFAALVQGYGGFGFGLVSMALLNLLLLVMPITGMPIAALSVVITLAGVVVIGTLLKVTHTSGQVRWREVWALLLGMAPGQYLGYLFIERAGDRAVFHILLGVVLVSFAVIGSRQPHAKRHLPRALGLPVGLLSGFIGGAFVSGGPPIVMFLYAQADDPREMKATIQAVFVAGLLYRLAVIGLHGDFTGPVALLALLALPVVIPLMLLGHRRSQLGSVEQFKRAVNLMIGSLGVLSLARGLYQAWSVGAIW